MSNEIVVYDKIGDPTAFIDALGKSMFEARMFGCTNESQGKILALACVAERKNPIELSRVFHIIEGKLSMRADAMLAEFRKRGGKVKWINSGDDGVSAKGKFTFENEESEWSFSMDDAKRAKLVKPNSNWEKNPDAMLRARVISKAVRALCPEICAGYYTEEELTDVIGDGEKKGEKPGLDAEAVLAAAAAAAGNGATTTPEGIQGAAVSTAANVTTLDDKNVIDVPFEVRDETKPSPDDPCLPAQAQRIRDLFAAVGANPEQQTDILARRKANAVRNLTVGQANELIGALSAKVEAITQPLPTGKETDPCTSEQANTIRQLLRETNSPEIATRVIAALKKGGKTTLADLSWRDAVVLERALRCKEMEAFFSRDLDKFAEPTELAKGEGYIPEHVDSADADKAVIA